MSPARDESRIQVGVDAHLFSRHRIKGKSGSYLGDSASTLGDDHKVDDDQNGKDDQPDNRISSHHEGTEGLNDMPCGGWALVSMEQNQPGRCDIQRKAEQGGDEKEGRKNGKLECTPSVHCYKEDDDRQSNIEGQQNIQ
jgi:hypothetical protein